jgi:hypothetical protein
LNIVEILNWFDFLSLSLLSVTIPTYAISVAFLGRESRRSVWDREKRQKDLKKKLEAMSKQSQVGIEALEEEIGECQKDIQKLNGRSKEFSLKGAFLYPFVSFAVAFASSLCGISIFEPPPSNLYFASIGAGLLSVLSLLYGSYRLYRSLCAINEAALSPETHAAIRVSFLSGSTAETFMHSQNDEVLIDIHNYGREMAEDTLVHLYLPPEFVVRKLSGPSRSPIAEIAYTFVQPKGERVDYAGYTTCEADIEEIHADMLCLLSLGKVRMPRAPGRYAVPVRVWEKRLGRTESALTFDVT